MGYQTIKLHYEKKNNEVKLTEFIKSLSAIQKLIDIIGNSETEKFIGDTKAGLPPPPLQYNNLKHQDVKIISSDRGSIVLTILLPIGINLASQLLIDLIKYGWKYLKKTHNGKIHSQIKQTDPIISKEISTIAKKIIPNDSELSIYAEGEEELSSSIEINDDNE